MRGHAAAGDDGSRGRRGKGRAENTKLNVRLTIAIDDLDRFITSTRTTRRECDGSIDSPLVGGKTRGQRGMFNLFVHDGRSGAEEDALPPPLHGRRRAAAARSSA